MAFDPKFLERLKKQVIEAEKRLQKLEESIRKAELVGLDVSEYRRRAEELRSFIERVRKVYGV